MVSCEMTTPSRNTAGLAVGGIALLLLHLAFGLFYALWSIADGEAVNRMESAGGYDVAYLLPNAYLMWIAAQASLVLVLVIDALYVLLLVARRDG